MVPQHHLLLQLSKHAMGHFLQTLNKEPAEVLENEKMPKPRPFSAGILCKICSLFSSVYMLRNLFPPDREEAQGLPQQSRNIAM